MNKYIIYDENEPSTVLYSAIAMSEEEVQVLAQQKEIDLSGLKIEHVRSDVKDQLGHPYAPEIIDALVY